MDPLQQSAAMNMALQYQAMLGLPPLTNVGAQLTMTPAGTVAQPVIVDRTLDPQAEIADEFNKIAQEGVQEAVSDEVFSHYQHREIIPGALPHPGDIVEAGSLAALLPPPPTYPLSDSLPDEAITSGKLSSLQLEGVIYACQRHQLLLPNGTRAGFFIGDGAGVGKGRQISGIILDNFARGRTKHVWFSISTDLIVDARRDLTDIGCHVKVIEGCQQLDKESRVFGLPADFKEGVIFSTYATLVSAVQKGGSLSGSKQSRLQQLIDWCGGAEFDGCLVFDECHKAKNFVPNKEQASTKVALAVTSIQRLLPKARVVYCSATGVTDVKNMAFMERLGLWGEGAPFKSFDQFLETVQRKGLGVAEMLAMEMKTSGMYVSRGLSFKQAEFVTIEVPLTEVQTKIYDTAAHVWNELRKALESAINRTNTTNTRIWSSFWGVHQRFFKQLCLGMKVPAIIKETKQALEEGYSVVIGLQTTGEASLESEMGKNGSTGTGWVSLCKEIYSRFVRQHFPTMVDKPHSTTGPEEDPWSAQAKNMLLEFADKIHLPNSPLDEIIHQLGGPEKVAEMTGRRGRMVCTSSDTQPHYQLRDSDSAGCLDSLNVRERNHFMEGRKLVAIISDAASTGISLHADQRAANQRRRIHLTVELPWSADKAVQQLGRSHRSNQSSGPIYKLLTTNLGGERRFAAAVARRLQSLGALTKGDRRAATGADLTEFNFDTPYGRSALRTMYNAVCQGTIVAGVEFSSINMGKYQLEQLNTELAECLLLMGVLDQDVLRSSVKVKDADCRDVGKFLNRILGMSVKRQNLIFNYFCQALKAHVSRAKKEGSYNEGLVDIMATKVEMVREPREVFKEAATHNNTTNHLVLSIDRGMPWDMAVTRSENYSGPDDGFYCSRRDVRGKKLYILATQKEGSSHQFRIARPNTGVSMFEEERGDLMQKYVKVNAEKAEAGWKDQYETSKNLCMHGPHCKNGPSCKVGTRCYEMHLLCGGIVTLMSLLDTTIAKYAAGLQLSKADCTLRVVRVQLTNGERVVGIRYPELLIPQVEKDLKEQKTIEFFMQKQKNQATPGTEVPATSMSPQDPVIHSLKYKTEDCTQVNPRCRKKALTPPVTMKNFFKPIVKKNTAAQNQSDKKKSLDKNGILEKNQDLKSNENSSKRSLDASSADSSGRADSPESNTNKTDVDKSKAETSAIDNQDDSDDFVTFSSQRNQLKSQGSIQFGNSLASASKSGQKRPPPKSKDMPRTKKPKQTSILASLGRKKSVKVETEVTERKCPVCQTVFPRGLFNEDINKHIDNCLIE